MRILLLGGTSDARWLSDHLTAAGISVIYSLAGLVRVPSMSCQVLVGGFSQFGGLEAYLKDQSKLGLGIDMIIDATHPYAQKMSDKAVITAATMGIVCWRFYRPEWEKKPADLWQNYQDQSHLLSILATEFKDKKTLLLSAGQFSQQELEAISSLSFENIIIRTAVAPEFSLKHLSKLTWLKAIGPFSYSAEKDLIRQYDIDVIVSKNSGGDSTSAKLEVARELQIPVLMLARPKLQPANAEFYDLERCLQAILAKQMTD